MKRWNVVKRVRPFVVMGAIALAVLIALTTSSANLKAQTGSWEAKYWNNRTLSGNPVLIRQEAEISYDWGAGSPAPEVFVDNFSAQWTRTVNLPTGTFRFSATADDGIRVLVNNTVIIDAWYDSQVRTITADVSLGAGNHTITVQYYEAGGVAVAGFTFSQISGTTPPPTNAWRAEYYANANLSGAPVLVRDESAVNYNWGFGSPAPGVPADFFSARWTRTVNLERGRYRFTTVTDDGVRLRFNGTLIIDQWRIQAAATYSNEVDWPGGSATISMEYFENTERAEARLSWVLVGGGVTPPPTGTWRAEYFNNMGLSGSPVVTRNESAVNYNWGYGTPDPAVPPDHFSARWTTTIAVNPGRYRFTVTSDDGVRLYVNNRLVVDAWYDRAVQTNTIDVDLPGGSIPVRVEYYENTLLAEVRVSWAFISGGGTGGPYPGTATVTAYRLNVRTGPGTSFPIITTLNQNQTVGLTGFRNADGSWVQVGLANGVVGWVSSVYVRTSIPISSLTPIGGTPPPPSGQGTGQVTAYYLNVRTGPGTGYPVLTTLTQGTTVRLIGRNADATWVKIIMPDGRQGWVSAVYLTTSIPVVNLPIMNI